jgi:hypothetical protein
MHRMADRSFVVRALVALGALAGIALSLPLWQTRTTYPRVPLFDFLPAFPSPLDTLFPLAFAAALVFVVFCPRFKQVGILWMAAAIVLVLQDQSRMQPWFVEYMLLLAAMVFSKDKESALDACRLVLVAIYFWTGVHKMNDSFLASLFPWIVSPLQTFGLAARIQGAGILIPYAEMAMGVSLLFWRTRRTGVIAIVATHLFLLAMLGPWALGWNRVVWPWNLIMMALAPCLFWHTDSSVKNILIPGSTGIRLILFTFVIILPPLSLVGFWDTYPSFALYSGNPLSGSVILTPSAWERLAPQLRAVAERTDSGAYRIYFSDWSNATMHVPAYPAKRVLREVARSFCAIRRIETDLTFVLEKPTEWLYRPGWKEILESRELCPRTVVSSS